MTKKYTSSDISRIIERVKSGDNDAEKQGNFTSDTAVTPFVGRKKDIVGITPGFKLKHRPTGLVYTVKTVNLAEKDLVLTLTSGDGRDLDVASKEFKNYERL